MAKYGYEELQVLLATQKDLNLEEAFGHIAKFFIDNLVKRTLSYLLAFSEEGKPEWLTSIDGYLRTVDSLKDYKVYSGTASDTEAEIIFDNVSKTVDIWVRTNPMNICFKMKGKTDYGDWITLDAESFYSISAEIESAKVINATAGNNADYQISVWW